MSKLVSDRQNFNLEITGGRIWIDPTRTEGDERLGVIAHELIHVLGRAHPDPARFPDSIMIAGGGDGPTEHILHPLDRAALLAVYSRVEPGGTPDAIDLELGAWADTSTHIYGVLGLPAGEVAFGAAFSNGLLLPWASGPAPDTALAENPRLAGTARWSGRLLGLTPAAEAVAGVADLAVYLESLDGDLNFTGLEYWPEGAAPGAVGTGSMWRDGDLGYRVEVRCNTFLRAGGDAAAELSMPIAGDRSAHVEYVPPQVVTEFVRTEFRHEGMPLDGIRYRSARHEGGNSLVLFASQDNLAGSMGAGIQSVFTGADRWIELVGREEREVSGSDAEAWDREAPQPFEWV